MAHYVLYFLLFFSISAFSFDAAKINTIRNARLFHDTVSRHEEQLTGKHGRHVNSSSLYLAHAMIDGAVLRDTNFDGANLSFAILSASDFTGSSFRNADVTGVRFSLTNLSATDFSGATYFENGKDNPVTKAWLESKEPTGSR